MLPLENEIKQILADPEQIIEKEVKIATETTGKIFLGLSVSPLKEPDSLISRGAVIIVRDLTMIRELEQKVIVSEKFAALGRLSAGIAHEIRNPLEFHPRFHPIFSEEDPTWTKKIIVTLI